MLFMFQEALYIGQFSILYNIVGKILGQVQ